MHIVRRQRMPNLAFQKRKQKDSNDKSIENAFNQKILDSILDDDDELFSQLITETSTNFSDINKTFDMTNYKIPELLMYKPTYASLCACFGSQKCFNTISMLLPGGISSEEMKQMDEIDRSPIHFACIGGNLDIVRELEQAGFDLNCEDLKGFKPSHYAAMSGNCDVMKFLWTKGGDVLSISTNPMIYYIMKPIEVACLYGNLEIVRFICESVLSDISKFSLFLSKKYPTPLHYACIGGHDNIVDYFLSKQELIKCQINELDQDSRNPLLCACHNGSLKCIKSLLNYNKGKSNFSISGRKHLPLVDASEGGYLDVVQFLLKQKNIKIQQQTSRKITAIDAAISNDHLDIVKFLLQNGATENYDSKKIGFLALSAFETGNIEMVRFLDENLKIPYTENSQIEDITLDDKTVIEFESLSFGDRYMQEACNSKNEEMVNFLLEKKCTLNSINPLMIIRARAFNFLDFLIKKGFDISTPNQSSFMPPIVSLIRFGDFNDVKNFISKGAMINKNIVTRYNLVQLASSKGDSKLFKFMMSFNPDLTEDDYLHSLKNAIIKYYSSDKNDQNETNECISIIELILDYSKIDINTAMCNNYESFISYAANRKCLKLLDIFEKHGANFKDCPLNYEQMTDEEDLEVLNYLKDHGCKFKNVLNRKITLSRPYKSPFKAMFPRFALIGSLCIDTLLFIMDFTPPKTILSAKAGNMNVIDVFIKYKSTKGILKSYSLTGSIIYPLHMDKAGYEKWVKNTNDTELINIVIKS